MEIDEIKKQIQFAIDSVTNFPEPYRLKAFEIILANSLEALSEKEPLHPTQGKSPTETNPSSIGERIEKLAKDANLAVEQLKDIFDFKENEPIFIGRVEGKEAEKQAHISQLILLVMHDVYGHEWITTSFLWQALEGCRIGSLGHLARNLSTREDVFRWVGKGKGRKYKLTEFGKRTALEILRQLAPQ